MAITHAAFRNKYLGKFVETRNSSKYTLNQCVDLALQYAVDVWGIPLTESNLPRGNAIKWGKGTFIKNYYGTWVPNGPTNIAPQGSIIVFSGPTAAGHIAIVDSADKFNVTVIEQNAGGKAHDAAILNKTERAKNCVKIGTHINYKNVMGWYEMLDVSTLLCEANPVYKVKTNLFWQPFQPWK